MGLRGSAGKPKWHQSLAASTRSDPRPPSCRAGASQLRPPSKHTDNHTSIQAIQDCMPRWGPRSRRQERSRKYIYIYIYKQYVFIYVYTEREYGRLKSDLIIYAACKLHKLKSSILTSAPARRDVDNTQSYTYIYICIYIYIICLYSVNMFVCISVYIYKCMYINSLCIYIYIYICFLNMLMYVQCICIYMYTDIERDR